jgi:hypothetical protein
MIIFILVGVLAAFIVFEVLSVRVSMKHLRVNCELDMRLVEPDEVITMRYTVYNFNRWPVLFVSLFFYFTDDADVREDEAFLKRYLKRGVGGRRLTVRLFLMPHRLYSGKVHFSLKGRGIHEPGRFYIEAGDLLGFRTTAYSKCEPPTVVCTAAMAPEGDEIETLGGLMGDLSVRRFIFEDPNLLIGYHEYTGTEPMRSISWIQTAKTGRLMVKQNDYTVDNDVSVVVNMEKGSRELLEKTLSLTRTVCEYLEERRIPYALLTNSDLLDVPEGLGKNHLRQILYRIGVSRLACYYRFGNLVDKCILERHQNRGYILVMPKRDEDWDDEIARLQARFDHPLCVLYAEEEAAV